MKKLLPCLALLFTGVLSAQTAPIETGEMWAGAAFKLEYNKKWTFQIEEQLRLWNHLGDVKSTFTEVSVGYEIIKDLEVVGSYRFTVVPNSFAQDAIEKSAFNQSRFMLDLKYELDKKGFPLSLEYRQRIQDTRELYTDYKVTYWRNRFGLEWEATDDITPYMEYESFYRMNQKKEFRRNRYSFGIEWRINKEMDISTFYRVDQQINTKVNGRENIVGIAYSYKMEVDNRKKKKK